MSLAASSAAAPASAKVLVFDCPAAPILPKRTVWLAPSSSISQNLLLSPSESSKRLTLPVAAFTAGGVASGAGAAGAPGPFAGSAGVAFAPLEAAAGFFAGCGAGAAEAAEAGG